jgi:DNA-binding transcriptional LysR family regulator
VRPGTTDIMDSRNEAGGMNMTDKQIRYFAAVVELHSFTEAADACFISQSAISQQIRALEDELGVLLIVRENRKFHLTPAGEYFYRQSQVILHEIDAMKLETKRISEDAELQLSIGYLKNYGGGEVHQAVTEFTKTYPEVSIHIINGNHEKLYELLRTGQVDLVLNDQRRAFSDEYVNFRTSAMYLLYRNIFPPCPGEDGYVDYIRFETIAVYIGGIRKSAQE